MKKKLCTIWQHVRLKERHTKHTHTDGNRAHRARARGGGAAGRGGQRARRGRGGGRSGGGVTHTHTTVKKVDTGNCIDTKIDVNKTCVGSGRARARRLSV